MKNPTILQCMNCKNFKEVHDIASQVKCGFKPTSSMMEYRSIIDNKTVDCPMKKFGLNFKTQQLNNPQT